MPEMNWVAIRMLTGDKVKFIGLVFGVAFSTLLITQQLTIFVNLLFRGGVAVQEVSTANVWVMDPATRTVEVIYPMPITALDRVRSVSGVAYASPMLRSNASIRTPEGDLEGVTVVGVDDSSLVGIPRKMAEGNPAQLMDPDAVFIDDVGARKLFAPGQTVIGSQLELNDQRAVIKGIVDSTPTFTAVPLSAGKATAELRLRLPCALSLSLRMIGVRCACWSGWALRFALSTY